LQQNLLMLNAPSLPYSLKSANQIKSKSNQSLSISLSLSVCLALSLSLSRPCRYAAVVCHHTHNPPDPANPGGFWDLLFSDVQPKVRLKVCPCVTRHAKRHDTTAAAANGLLMAAFSRQRLGESTVHNHIRRISEASGDMTLL